MAHLTADLFGDRATTCFANTTKRLVKRPKWVFADRGFGLHRPLISMHPRVERLTPRIYNLPLGLILHGV